jgi:hypothetical protein
MIMSNNKNLISLATRLGLSPDCTFGELIARRDKERRDRARLARRSRIKHEIERIADYFRERKKKIIGP